MSNISPDTVEDSSILKDAQQLVVCGDIVEVGAFLIGKEKVRFPNRVQHGGVQVKRGIWIFTVRQPRVIPLLSQEDVHSVILQRRQAALHILQGRVWGSGNACWLKRISFHLFDEVNSKIVLVNMPDNDNPDTQNMHLQLSLLKKQ